MAVLLFDIEKAFDCIPRDRAFSELSEMAGSNGLKLIVEDLHRGTRYLLLVKDGKVSMEIRNTERAIQSQGVSDVSTAAPAV